MPNKELLRQLELEKQRRGMNRPVSEPPSESVGFMSGDKGGRSALEYELEAYRAQQKRNRWLSFGAVCGVLSLILELAFHGPAVIGPLLGRFVK